MTRIKDKFEELKKNNKAAFISFLTGGDPDLETFYQILIDLPKNGADLIEIGIPFLDPSGDGPIIEKASKRAIENGATLKKILKIIVKFREIDNKTPIILMGYYNSILRYGSKQFVEDAKKIGIDGLLMVDLPIEEDDELFTICQKNNLDFIKLITPTTDKNRMKQIIKKASGFIYFVSIAGITGTKSSDPKENKRFIKQIKELTNLPVAIGFGIKTRQNVQEMINIKADGVIVGSALVNVIKEGLEADLTKDKIRSNLLNFNKNLAS